MKKFIIRKMIIVTKPNMKEIPKNLNSKYMIDAIWNGIISILGVVVIILAIF